MSTEGVLVVTLLIDGVVSTGMTREEMTEVRGKEMVVDKRRKPVYIRPAPFFKLRWINKPNRPHFETPLGHEICTRSLSGASSLLSYTIRGARLTRTVSLGRPRAS